MFDAKPIGAEQAIQHPIAHLHARLQAVALLVHRTAARFDAGVDGFQIAGEANMAKILSAELVFDAADHAVQTLGAKAWDEREGIMDLYLDASLRPIGPDLPGARAQLRGPARSRSAQPPLKRLIQATWSHPL